MIPEKQRPREAKIYKIGGESKEAVILIGSSLLVPERVEVKVGEEWKKGEGAHKVEPGEYSVRDLDTGDEKVIEVDPNSNYLKQAA